MGNGFIPDIFASDVFLPEVHKLTLIIGLLLIGFNVVSKIRARKAQNFLWLRDRNPVISLSGRWYSCP